MIDPTSKDNPRFKELVKVRWGFGWNVPVGAKLSGVRLSWQKEQTLQAGERGLEAASGAGPCGGGG